MKFPRIDELSKRRELLIGKVKIANFVCGHLVVLPTPRLLEITRAEIPCKAVFDAHSSLSDV